MSESVSSDTHLSGGVSFSVHGNVETEVYHPDQHSGETSWFTVPFETSHSTNISPNDSFLFENSSEVEQAASSVLQIDELNEQRNADTVNSLMRAENDGSSISKRQKLLPESDLGHDVTPLASATSPETIRFLIQSIHSSQNAEFIKITIEKLYKLSREDLSLELIFYFNGIPVLISVLSFDSGVILIYAASIIHKLLLRRDEAAARAVESSGGVPRLVSLLQRGEQNLLAVVIDSLRLMAVKTELVKATLLNFNYIKDLLSILNSASNKNLLWMTCRLLRVLSFDWSFKETLVAAGAVSLLSELLRTESYGQIEFNCLVILRNVSSIIRNFSRLENIVKFCVWSLQSRFVNALPHALVILANVTYLSSQTKMAAFGAGCIPVLLDLVRDPSSSIDVVEGAVHVLKNLTYKHSGSPAARKCLRENGGARMLRALLEPPYRWSIINAVIELIRNTSFHREVCDAGVCLQFVEALSCLLRVAWQSHSECSEEVSQLVDHSQYVANVGAKDSIRGILDALLCHIQKRKKYVKEVMLNKRIVTILICLLSHSELSVQDAADALLTKLLHGDSGFHILQEPDNMDSLARLFSESADERVKKVINKLVPFHATELFEIINQSLAKGRAGSQNAKKTDANNQPVQEPTPTTSSQASQTQAPSPHDEDGTLFCGWEDCSRLQATQGEMAVWEAFFQNPYEREREYWDKF